MKDEKDLLVGEYRKSPAFAGYHIFAPAGHIERYMEDALFKFYEAKKDDPIMAATNLFGNIINIHPFEDGDGRIFRLILAHVLIQMKCCLFPMILTLFRMGFFGAAHGWGGPFWSPLPKIRHTYPTMMKLGTVIPYLRKIQKMYKSRDKSLGFC